MSRTAFYADLDMMITVQHIQFRAEGYIERSSLSRLDIPLLGLPPTEIEFREAARLFGLSQLAAALNVTLDFAAAVRSRLGVRWLEETFAQLLLQAKRENRTDLLSLRLHVPENSAELEDDDIEFGFEGPVL